MDLNLFPATMADFTLLGTLDGDQTALEPQLWDASAKYTELITSPGALGLMQGQRLAFRPAPASAPVTAWPTTATGHSRVPRPESQEDWDAKQDTIRKLYLEENLPLQDVIDTMSKKHSFSATERVYKRQFQKWNWKKYNTKAHRQSRAQCIHVETSRGMATCRRPARRRRPNQVSVQNSNITVYYLAGRSNPNIAQDSTTFTIPLLHGNQTYEWTEKTYANLREIIVGTARRNPAWSQSNRFEGMPSAGVPAFRNFELAFELFDLKDYTNYGSILREAFRAVENTVHSAYEPIDMFDCLLINIPRRIFIEDKPEILQAYLLFVSRMLDIRRPGQPITFAATTMQKLFSTEAEPINRHTLSMMIRIVSDCYAEVLGEYNMRSIHARRNVLNTVKDPGSDLDISGLQTLYHSLTSWMDDIVERLGEASPEYHAVAMTTLRLVPSAILPAGYALELCKKGLSLLTKANPEPQEDWTSESLSFLSTYHYIMANMFRTENESLAIFYLRQSLTSREILCRKFDRDSDTFTTLRTLVDIQRIWLIEKLTSLGRVQEAAELRAALAQSDYLLDVQKKDASLLTELFADDLPQECY